VALKSAETEVGNLPGRLNIIALEHRHITIVYPTADHFFLSWATSGPAVKEGIALVIAASRVFRRCQAQSVTFGTQLYAHPDSLMGRWPTTALQSAAYCFPHLIVCV
jgi:hypothetical protein